MISPCMKSENNKRKDCCDMSTWTCHDDLDFCVPRNCINLWHISICPILHNPFTMTFQPWIVCVILTYRKVVKFYVYIFRYVCVEDHNIMKKTLSATDVLAPISMKNAVKCDTSCELQNQWVIKTLNAPCASFGEHVCWSVCSSPPHTTPWLPAIERVCSRS